MVAGKETAWTGPFLCPPSLLFPPACRFVGVQVCVWTFFGPSVSQDPLFGAAVDLPSEKTMQNLSQIGQTEPEWAKLGPNGPNSAQMGQTRL